MPPGKQNLPRPWRSLPATRASNLETGLKWGSRLMKKVQKFYKSTTCNKFINLALNLLHDRRTPAAAFFPTLASEFN
jgi:hypothetical protein